MIERVRKVRKDFGYTQEEFSKKINISRSNLAGIETGKVGLTDRTISDICREFNINENWLRNGKGEMKNVTASKTIMKALVEEHHLDELDERLIVEYTKLVPSQRQAIKVFMINSFMSYQEMMEEHQNRSYEYEITTNNTGNASDSKHDQSKKANTLDSIKVAEEFHAEKDTIHVKNVNTREVFKNIPPRGESKE